MTKELEPVLRRIIYQEISFIWDKVLDDGEHIVNCCSIPKEMYISVWNQIYEELEPLIILYQSKYGNRNEAINEMQKWHNYRGKT